MLMKLTPGRTSLLKKQSSLAYMFMYSRLKQCIKLMFTTLDNGRNTTLMPLPPNIMLFIIKRIYCRHKITDNLPLGQRHH